MGLCSANRKSPAFRSIAMLSLSLWYIFWDNYSGQEVYHDVA
jgi:hypothetical protein